MLEKPELLVTAIGYGWRRKFLVGERSHFCLKNVKILYAVQFTINPV
jgi:hypothetical protein